MGSVRNARARMPQTPDRFSNISEDSVEPSNPTWPLGGSGNAFSQQQQQNRQIPPLRPPRPSYVPSILQNSDNQQQGQNYGQQSPQYSRDLGPHQQQAKYWEPNYHSTTSALTPGTSSNRDSETSSVGSIPDFPIASLPGNASAQNQRRNVNIGPPPTQRRGPSSFYSQSPTWVTSIPEEGIELPRQQPYKSRAQVLSEDSWQDDSPDFMMNRDSTTSVPGEHLVEPAGLVRNASMGKQYKPSVTTVRPANENLRQQKGFAAPQPTVVDRSHLAAEHTVFVESVDSDDEDTSIHGRDSMEGATFLRNGSSDSDLRKEAMVREKDALVSPLYSRDASPKRQDPRVERLMAGLEKGGALPVGTAVPLLPEAQKSPMPSFVEQASNRASLTSLTDLIRRAGKVKNNLEKGKTASRLGLLDFFSGGSKSDLLKTANGKDDRPRDSISDVLQAFPPPATGTPTRLSGSRWPSPFVNSSEEPTYKSESRPKKQRNPKGRRCCGMPLWGFILLCILLVVLIAAAVLIPIFLIVIPNQQKANSCSSTLPCSNGGASFSNANTCTCICTGGFTGPQCTQSAPVASDCTTTDLDLVKKATIGTKVLSILSGSSNFSIPLNTTILLSNFSQSKLFCGDENNLVTFLNAGSSSQRRDVNPQATVTEIRVAPTPTAIVTDGSATGAPSTPAPANPEKSQIGFAQAAVLYVLQQSNLDNARTLRDAVDTAFRNGNWYGPVSATSDVTVDLRRSVVTVGGTSAGTGTNQ